MTARSPRITRRTGLALLASAPLATLAGPRAVAGYDLPSFPEQDVRLLRPGDAAYEQYQPIYNKRMEQRPRWRAMCLTPDGVRRLVDVARESRIPFAIRSGGHSFEGLSQSDALSIDVRPLNRISFDPATRSLTVGAGVALGDVYRAAARAGMCFPAGSCPTVGLAGHIHGGGFGLLSRPLGLASDALLAVDLVDAAGQQRHVSAETDPDLFWALQGGGGGTFGAATSFTVGLFPSPPMFTLAQSFVLDQPAASRLVDGWQRWITSLPEECATILTVRSVGNARISVRLAGQYYGENPAVLSAALANLSGLSGQAIAPQIRGRSFLEAVGRFSGGWNYESKFSKGKSDFVMSPLPAAGVDTLLRGVTALPPNDIVVIMDAYGGAIRKRRGSETAFAHREALYSIQYYSSWFDASKTGQRVAGLRGVYDAMRPFLPGYSYVNYCDLDLKDWRRAYWGDNAQRLAQVKAHVDPTNLFHHAQSITPAI